MEKHNHKLKREEKEKIFRRHVDQKKTNSRKGSKEGLGSFRTEEIAEGNSYFSRFVHRERFGYHWSLIKNKRHS